MRRCGAARQEPHGSSPCPWQDFIRNGVQQMEREAALNARAGNVGGAQAGSSDDDDDDDDDVPHAEEPVVRELAAGPGGAVANAADGEAGATEASSGEQ
jgi:hypothetical protein